MSTARSIQKEIPPVHQLAHKADTSVTKGVNKSNNIISKNIVTNMQMGQIFDGCSGQENQYPYQSTQQSAYRARETTPTVSKEISETTGTIGAISVAGPARSAVPAVLSMPAEHITNAFLSTLSSKADMDRMTVTLQQVLRDEFKEIKESLHSLTTRVDSIEQTQTATEQKIEILEAKLTAQSHSSKYYATPTRQFRK